MRLRFPNPGLKLKPEMFARVKIESPVTKQAMVVPMEAVLDTGLKQHVFIALGAARPGGGAGSYDGQDYRKVLRPQGG